VIYWRHIKRIGDRQVQGHNALDIVKKYHPEITKVVDGKKGIKINVTAEDCKNAKRRSPGNCAMAKAFKRKYDGAIISMSVAYLIKGHTAHRYMVPQSVTREIVSFDRHHDFAPGDYQLRAPPKSMSLGKRLYSQKKRMNAGAARYQNDKPRAHKTVGIRSL
jgi:hypothetical protein